MHDLSVGQGCLVSWRSSLVQVDAPPTLSINYTLTQCQNLSWGDLSLPMKGTQSLTFPLTELFQFRLQGKRSTCHSCTSSRLAWRRIFSLLPVPTLGFLRAYGTSKGAYMQCAAADDSSQCQYHQRMPRDSSCAFHRRVSSCASPFQLSFFPSRTL